MQIGLLGPLQVRDDAGNPVLVGGRQLRALLAVLAMDAGKTVPTAVLTARLWPDDEPADPGNALQTLVSRLRATFRQAAAGSGSGAGSGRGSGIGGLIESDPSGYRLAVPPAAVDVHAFEAGIAAGRRALAEGDPQRAAQLLADALSLWRGLPLADAATAEFADAIAVRLADLRAEAVLDRIDAELALGKAAGLVGELKSLLAADPLAERPRALLMRALAAAGRPAEALTEYERAREVLADRLGVDPSPALEQVYLTILREPGLPPAAATQGLPEPVTSFVGRDAELTDLRKLIGSARLVTLTGPGGVGKTRLAIEAARQLGGPGGEPGARAWFIPLARVSDAAEVPFAVLDVLGIRQPLWGPRSDAAATDPASRLSAVLASSGDLLILDNCEHVIDAAAALAARLLAGCPRLTIVATSREPLRIDGETLSPVAVLPFPTGPGAPVTPAAADDAVDDAAGDTAFLGEYAAVRLLCDRAAQVRPGFRLDPANAAAVARVCRSLDGIPLAIELAAVWLRVLSPAQLAERLDDRFALLTAGDRTALPRHQTLWAVVDWSWELLSDRERVLARRLSAFPAGATLAAVERVCADDLLPRAAVLEALSGVAGKSLLFVSDGPRYGMLETVRAYCLEQLADAGEEHQFAEAVGRHYLDLAERLDPRLRAPGQAEALRELTAEQDNLHASLRWAIGQGEAELALRFVRALGWYWMLRGHTGESDALAREVLAMTAAAPDTRLVNEAKVIAALMSAGPSWDLAVLLPALSAAIAALTALEPDVTKWHPVAAFGQPMFFLCEMRPEQARAAFDCWDAAADPWLRAVGLFFRASFDSMLGESGQTEVTCQAALAAFRALGDAWGIAASLFQLAEFAQLRADHAVAIAALQEAQDCAQQLGAVSDFSQMGAKLAQIKLRAGDPAGARAALDRAWELQRGRGGKPEWLAWLNLVAAEIAWYDGDHGTAAAHGAEALNRLAGLGSPWWNGFRALTRSRLAVIKLDEGDHDAARELLTTALRDASAWVERPAVAAVMDAIAAMAVRTDAVAAARLLGAAHSVRGTFDESSLDAPAVRAAARRELGDDAFDRAYHSGLELSYQDSLALAHQVLRR